MVEGEAISNATASVVPSDRKARKPELLPLGLSQAHPVGEGLYP